MAALSIPDDIDFSAIPAAISALRDASGSKAPTAITASGAVDPHTTKVYYVTKAGVAALTLAAPTITTDDGVTISIVSATAFAHTLTATGLLKTGSASTDVATYAAFAGASLTLQARQGSWYVRSQNGITFS